MAQNPPSTDARKKTVKLYGGPLDGRLVEVPATADEYVTTFWTYEFAGKQDRQEMFAVRPTERRLRKFIAWYVGKFGRDPRIDEAMGRLQPTVGTTDKHGQGARRRAEKRASS